LHFGHGLVFELPYGNGAAFEMYCGTNDIHPTIIKKSSFETPLIMTSKVSRHLFQGHGYVQ
jgi:hypothetical protein